LFATTRGINWRGVLEGMLGESDGFFFLKFPWFSKIPTNFSRVIPILPEQPHSGKTLLNPFVFPYNLYHSNELTFSHPLFHVLLKIKIQRDLLNTRRGKFTHNI
jgi:hypothetical protein